MNELRSGQGNPGAANPELGAANPELKALAAEASRALAALDAARLEELAVYCEALIRKLGPELMERDGRRKMARQVREAQDDMAVLGRVLEATRANLCVMTRLREIRLGQIEYKALGGMAIGSIGTGSQAGDGDGNH